MTIHGIGHLFPDGEVPLSQQCTEKAMSDDGLQKYIDGLEEKKAEPTCSESWQGDDCDGDLYYVIVAFNAEGDDQSSAVVMCSSHLSRKGLSP